MRRPHDRLVAIAATVTYGAVCATWRGEPRAGELRLFQRVNAAPERSWHRVPQQLDTPWTLPAAGLLLACRGSRPAAVAALVALPVEKGVEVLTKKLVRRPRPVMLESTALRDDAPREGPSLPSGHAAIAATAAYLLVRGSGSATLTGLGATATALASYVRVHQGAHWPGDVAAGAALGVAVAASLCVAADRVARG